MSPSGLLWAERVNFISSTTVDGALYGFTSALYIFCARSLYLQLKKDLVQRRQHAFNLLFMSLTMTLALLGVAVDSRNIQTFYLDHNDHPGGGLGYYNDVVGRLPISIVGYGIFLLLSLMMSGIQIWRLWIIWRASRYSLFVVALPVLSLLTLLGCEMAEIVMFAQQQGPELTPRLWQLFVYGNIASQLSVYVTVTVLITIRILVVRRRVMEVMGQTDNTNPYTSIISILVESFALESVWLIAESTVFLAIASPVFTALATFFIDTRIYVQVLAYLLVVYRVTTGRAWKEDTAEKLTTLQWNRDGLQTTQIGTQASILTTREEA